jgi:methionine sulfoxide reductase catalytic subunit
MEHDRSLPIGRAAFLGTIAAGIAGIAATSRWNVAVSRAVSGVSNVLTGSGDWRIYVVTGVPAFDPTSYALHVRGLVEKPVALSWPQVQNLPAAAQVSDFHCVTGWTVRHVHWQGIRPSTLIELVQPKPSARFVTFVSMEEPYVDQLTLQQFRLADVMLATHMDGKPLTADHGSPLRLVIPDMYGYKGVKWVREIRFEAKPAAGYWEQRGYDIDAWVGRSNGY